MNFLKFLALIAKGLAVAVMFDWTAISPTAGPIIFFVASLVKDGINRLGDFLDDGKLNDSFQTTPKVPPLVKLLIVGGLCVGLVGCAQFTTTQTDVSGYDDNGKATRTITTKATAYTLFEAKSALASFKATQTDKSQSASVGSLNQDATGGTNTAALAGEFLGNVIKAAK